MKNARFLTALLPLAASFAQAQNPSPAPVSVDPKFSTIVTRLESQPIPGAKLLYWDQALADVMGISTVPGRVGIPAFEQDVVKRMAVEVRQGATGLEKVTSPKSANGSPILFVEKDAHGGSGRAGYIKVGQAWVNIKGIGLTGMGNARSKPIGPPSTTFTSHSDGSATLEEAIKEAVYSRVADGDLKYGAAKVLAVISTNRTIKYPDGNEVPLALIVRAPLKRQDQAEDEGLRRQDKISESMGQANASRIMKGDLVNGSNIGAHGEMIDFGCLTHTCGYSPVTSSQKARFLREGSYYVDRPFYDRAIARYLLNQMGLPESHVEAAAQAGFFKPIEQVAFANGFRELVGRANASYKLDFDQLSDEQLEGNFKIHRWLEKLAPSFLRNPDQSKDDFVKAGLAEGRSLTTTPSDKIDAEAKKFLEPLWEALNGVVKANRISDRNAYANAVERIARFKNRDIRDVVRPIMFQKAAELARDYGRDGNAPKVQHVIDEIVMHNRTSTTPTSENIFHVTADTQATHLYLRTDARADGSHGLFAYPELPRATGKEQFMIRATTDNWQSHRDFAAKKIRNSYGTFYRVDIPHGDLPVTEDRLVFSPFYRDASGSTRFLAEGFNISGPRFLYNERLGLPANYVREPGIMRRFFDVRIFPTPEDLEGKSPVKHRLTPAEFAEVLAVDTEVLAVDSNVLHESVKTELRLFTPEEKNALAHSPEVKAQVNELLGSEKLDVPRIQLMIDSGALDMPTLLKALPSRFTLVPDRGSWYLDVGYVVVEMIVMDTKGNRLRIKPEDQELAAKQLLPMIEKMVRDPEAIKARIANISSPAFDQVMRFYETFYSRVPASSALASPEKLSAAYRDEMASVALSPKTSPTQKMRAGHRYLELLRDKATPVADKIFAALLDARLSQSDPETEKLFTQFVVEALSKLDAPKVILPLLSNHRQLDQTPMLAIFQFLNRHHEDAPKLAAQLAPKMTEYFGAGGQTSSGDIMSYLWFLERAGYVQKAFADPAFRKVFLSWTSRMDKIDSRFAEPLIGFGLRHQIPVEREVAALVQARTAKGGDLLARAQLLHLYALKQGDRETYRRALKMRASLLADAGRLQTTLSDIEYTSGLNFLDLWLDLVAENLSTLNAGTALKVLYVASTFGFSPEIQKRARELIRHPGFLESAAVTTLPLPLHSGLLNLIKALWTEHFVAYPKWMENHPGIEKHSFYPELLRLQKSAEHIRAARNRVPAMKVTPNCVDSLLELFR